MALEQESLLDSEDLDELAEPFETAEPISSFGTDFDVHGLVRRLNEGDIVIPNFNPPETDEELDVAGFQRAFVWRKYQMDRFVESLLLGYPVPGIFLIQQGDNKLLVLDGQQRLGTLQRFYAGTLANGSRFELEQVGTDYKGKTYQELSPEQRRSLDNAFLHATVIKFDPSTTSEEVIYQLFERLNASGTNLHPHEIRVALYPGALIDFLAELNRDKDWRELYGPKNLRLKDQEQILRFIAFYVEADSYEKPLKGFLNTFARNHRQLQDLDPEALRTVFGAVCKVLAQGPGKAALRVTRNINAALADAVMVGIARRLEAGPIQNPPDIAPRIESLLANPDFEAAIARATADEARVQLRLRLGTEVFRDLK